MPQLLEALGAPEQSGIDMVNRFSIENHPFVFQSSTGKIAGEIQSVCTVECRRLLRVTQTGSEQEDEC